MPKLLLVEQYFFPEGWGGAEIPRDIAVGLRKSGFDIDVLCSRDQYAPMAEQDPEDPASHGIKIFRVPRILPGPVHRFKLIRIVWFCLYALPRLLFHRGVDLYVTQTNPLLIVPTVAVVSALRRKPFIIIAQDLYPEALFASGLSGPGSLLGRALRQLFSWSYRRATRVVALGPFMRRRILQKGVHAHRVRTISNWATGDIRLVDARDNPLRAEWGLADRFVVLYSGNMGVGHEFETFLRGVQRAVSAGLDAVVVFVGGGIRLPEVRTLVSALGLSDRVMFKSFVPANVLPFSLGIADLAVVTLRDGFEGVVVPSKLMGYMARAIPALYIGPDSDIADLIRDADCGSWCLPEDAAAVANVLHRAASDRALLRERGENGRRSYDARYAREFALRQYIDVVGEALACARP